MIDTEGAVAAPEPQADQFQETVLSLLTEMSSRLSAQEERLVAIEQAPAAPQFVEASGRRDLGASAKSKRMVEDAGDGVPRADTIPLFPNGQRVPEMVMKQYTPRFGTGDTVLLNLDVVPHGRTDGRTRGELMAEKGTPQGYGEILDRPFLSDQTGEWKYRVKFSTKVMPGSNGGIVGLYESELLPA